MTKPDKTPLNPWHAATGETAPEGEVAIEALKHVRRNTAVVPPEEDARLLPRVIFAVAGVLLVAVLALLVLVWLKHRS
ncbi:MAG: hypothetical protein HY903_18520 [Deltaproteobacteria bacterium]|nr:hypothetical protein [Deltaproteobacteria bacterium]